VTQEKVNRVKTDKIDARRLAMNLESGDYKSCHVHDREQLEDRQVSRTLDQIISNIRMTKNRIRMFLHFHNLNGDDEGGTWKDARYLGLRSLRLSDSLQLSLNVYLDELEFLNNQKKRLLEKLKEFCERERYRASKDIKESFPGVGWLSAIRFTLEWGDMSRFKSGKHMASYTGLTSSEYSTGDSRHQGRITGQGPGNVRAWLIQCAWRSIKKDRVLLDKYKRVYKNSGSKKKAIVAVARKLAVRMRALELSKQTYCLAVIQ
jgi:transposase